MIMIMIELGKCYSICFGCKLSSQSLSSNSILLNISKNVVLVAEVTQPSLGVGIELGMAQIRNKNILCLFRPASGKG